MIRSRRLFLGVALSLCAACATGRRAAPPPAAPPPAAPLPVPLPPPVVTPALPSVEDPSDVLWDHRLDFARGGEPLVTIRLMEGQEEIALRVRGAAHVRLRGGGLVAIPAGARLTVGVRGARPARVGWYPLILDAPAADRARLDEARRLYEERGVRLRTRRIGNVHGIAGRVVDNRRELLLAATDGSEEAARAEIERLRSRFGARAALVQEVVERPGGTLVLSSEAGAPLGEADGVLVLEPDGDDDFLVEGVQHDLGKVAGAREDRTYRGRLYVAVDARGALAAVHGVPLEELLRGLVPSEMPASSPLEALKAQAVTARSNVLAQLGTRHLTDPFMLCAEVHCQAYRGDAARTPKTDLAVSETRGEALFGREDRTLVDAVYSAMCGGHSEDNDKVWGNAPNASLRGHPDLPNGDGRRWDRALQDERALRSFLEDGGGDGAFCRMPTSRRDRFRWERRFTQVELDRLLAPLGVGRVTGLFVTARGVSGRARVLEVRGAAGRAEAAGELRIRKLLRDLPSAMFVVNREGDDWVLKGGGWGHGAGMCQWGAVGRAESGQDYREILRAYFSGAEVAKMY
ncbi:MAG: SpoIID/LytB domain-containing protein [Anaeromyxobacter sp.]